ncbi:methyltransferase domain-containing protein [Streptomyces griseosporeus]|uniref:methyltransferase domain-containing protein n=1 Tax=Streptomyces griseosporeus TaxID=1910 RepID=UPI0036FA5B2A
MIADLARRAAPSGRGRLLDLACGTGQLAFPLRNRFADVWAVDSEAGMTEVVRAKGRPSAQPTSGRSPPVPKSWMPSRAASS